ncbi:MAG: hypothetical protein K6T75_03155 [Acetobacteraceae bacterium]|nr:hypothetical protein [Acetobacteraceae bacterium]
MRTPMETEAQRLLVRDWRWFEPLAALEKGLLEIHALEAAEDSPAFLLSALKPAPGGATLELYLHRPPDPLDAASRAYEEKAVQLAVTHPRWVCLAVDGQPLAGALCGVTRDWETRAQVFISPPSQPAEEGPRESLYRLVPPVPAAITDRTTLYTPDQVNQMAARGGLWALCDRGRPVSWAAVVHSFTLRAADLIGLVYTEPSHRRQGLASRVVRALTAEIAGRGRTAVYGASADNPGSCGVTQAAGLTPVTGYAVIGRKAIQQSGIDRKRWKCYPNP